MRRSSVRLRQVALTHDLGLSMKKPTYFFVTLLSGVVFLAGAVRSENPVGYDFLRTFVGARPSAMAGAFISVPGDIHNLSYNPAGLAALNAKQGTASYLNHLLDFQSGFLAYAQPFLQGTVAVGLHFLTMASLNEGTRVTWAAVNSEQTACPSQPATPEQS